MDAGGYRLVTRGQAGQLIIGPWNQSLYLPRHLHNTDFVVASEVTHHNWNASDNCTLNMPNGDR